MWINSRLTLLGRLYLYTAMGITAAIFLTKSVMEMHYDEDDFIYFIGASNYILTKVDIPTDDTVIDKSTRFKIVDLPSSYGKEFLVAWVRPDIEVNDICENCKHIQDSGDGKFYNLGRNEGLAIYSFSGLQNKLLITDADHLKINDQFVRFNLIDNWFQYILIAIVSLFVGITIYWPIRKLQKQITILVGAHQRFGDGHLQEQVNKALDKPLDKLACSFNDMAHSIASNFNESQVFAQAIPHELRTPLSRIQLASGLLRKKCREDQQIELINDIDHYIEDINDLITQIVTLSKLRTSLTSKIPHSGLTTDQKISLKEFVQSRLKEISKNEDIIVNINIDSQIAIMSHPVVLRLALDNLISNAFKYAKTQIRISYTANDNGNSIVVEDDGSGVEASKSNFIFTPFARLDDSRSRKTGGLGLGLAIAKASANYLGGDISIDSSPLGGAKFGLKLS